MPQYDVAIFLIDQWIKTDCGSPARSILETEKGQIPEIKHCTARRLAAYWAMRVRDYPNNFDK